MVLYSRKIAEIYLLPGVRFSGNLERQCSAREWLKRHMKLELSYKETVDQAKMTAYLEIDAIRHQSRSLRRMVEAVGAIIKSIEHANTDVTPSCSDFMTN